MKRLALVLFLGLPAAALAQARVLQFRSVEDPAFPPDPAVCARAGFAVNVRLGGRLSAYSTRARDGQVVAEETHSVGHATACAQITSLAFPPGLQQKFYVELTLADGVYSAAGTCTIVSNDVPQGGLVLAGCNLRLVSFPAGVAGGAVVSLSTFNPFRLPGFSTGSFWTVQLYPAGGGDQHGGDSDHAMEWVEGGDDGR